MNVSLVKISDTLLSDLFYKSSHSYSVESPSTLLPQISLSVGFQ